MTDIFTYNDPATNSNTNLVNTSFVTVQIAVVGMIDAVEQFFFYHMKTDIAAVFW